MRRNFMQVALIALLLASSPWAVLVARTESRADNSDAVGVSESKMTSDPLFDTAVNYLVGKGGEKITSADLDGDGYNDLIITRSTDHRTSILFNNGDGTFQSPIEYFTGYINYTAAAADFDGDGDIDLAIDNAGESAWVTILFNNGTGSFQGAVNYDVGDYPVSVMATDFDHDGDQDWAVTNARSGTVTVMLNNGDGSFGSRADYSTNGTWPSSAIAVDIDGDGYDDIVVGNQWSNSISVLRNKGNGTFYSPIIYEAGHEPISFACGDFDGDGDNDIAYVHWLQYTATVLINSGGGVLQKSADYHAAGGAQGLAAADFDRDGYTDLAAGNMYSGSVSIFRGKGDGTFETEVTYATGNTSDPWPVVASDLDNDGDQDLAVVSRNETGTLAILLNRTKQPASVTPVNFDIKPGSCPNPLNGTDQTRGKAVLPAAILGTADFDVHDIDPSTITLNGVSPIRWSYEDVSAPANKSNDSCACTGDGPDSFTDLTLKFDHNTIEATLITPPARPGIQAAAIATAPGVQGDPAEDGDGHAGPMSRNRKVLVVRGNLNDGTAFEGYDCVLFMSKDGASAIRVDELPRVAELGGNYPNPFNPNTIIKYSIPSKSQVTIEIFNMLGQRVRMLVNETKQSGSYQAEWNGTDDRGGSVATGIYLYRIQAGDFVETKKMVLLK